MKHHTNLLFKVWHVWGKKRRSLNYPVKWGYVSDRSPVPFCFAPMTRGRMTSFYFSISIRFGDKWIPSLMSYSINSFLSGEIEFAANLFVGRRLQAFPPHPLPFFSGDCKNLLKTKQSIKMKLFI